MISINDKFLLSDDICERIKSEYEHKLTFIKSDIRQQKNYHELDDGSWLFGEINKLISYNLGGEYSLYKRVTILKYSKGDYFAEHSDGPTNAYLTKQKEMPPLKPHFFGGVELCSKNEFVGGDFSVNGNVVNHKKGRMFTHGFSDLHEVTEVTDGIRWSIHFLILKENLFLI